MDGLKEALQPSMLQRGFRKVWQAFARQRKIDSTQVLSEEYVKDMLTPIYDEELGVDVPFYGYQI